MSGRAPGADGDPDAPAAAALAVLREVARRVGAAARLESSAGDAVLRSVVEAAAALIRAEAASIALLDQATGRLVFRVAAGERGAGVIGLDIDPGEGVAGYVFSTGQPLALGDAATDPRFGREAARQTGYVPRSLIAVPLGDDSGTLGVLEVLDRRDGEPFDLRDLDTAAVFARQATVAIRATRLDRDAATLLAAAIEALDREASLSPDQAAALVSAATADLAGRDAGDAGDDVWALADAVALVRDADPAQLGLVRDILGALARRSLVTTARRQRGGRP